MRIYFLKHAGHVSWIEARDSSVLYGVKGKEACHIGKGETAEGVGIRKPVPGTA